MDGQTDGRTDGQTDRATSTVACMRLEMYWSTMQVSSNPFKENQFLIAETIFYSKFLFNVRLSVKMVCRKILEYKSCCPEENHNQEVCSTVKYEDFVPRVLQRGDNTARFLCAPKILFQTFPERATVASISCLLGVLLKFTMRIKCVRQTASIARMTSGLEHRRTLTFWYSLHHTLLLVLACAERRSKSTEFTWNTSIFHHQLNSRRRATQVLPSMFFQEHEYGNYGGGKHERESSWCMMKGC